MARAQLLNGIKALFSKYISLQIFCLVFSAGFIVGSAYEAILLVSLGILR